MSENDPLTPENRVRLSTKTGDPIVPTGVDCDMADGRIWILGRTSADPRLGWLRSRIYEYVSYQDKVLVEDVRLAALLSLLKNYRVSQEEADWLLRRTDTYAIDATVGGRPVMPGEVSRQIDGKVGGHMPVDCIIGATLPTQEPIEFEYEHWLRSTLILNGLDPRHVPKDDMPALLRHLILLGKAIPPEEFVASAIEGAKRKHARGLVKPAQPENH